ncbi:MAG: adenylyltransferase/cytidyltransferase family protein [Verrucomicrobiota bacterium]
MSITDLPNKSWRSLDEAVKRRKELRSRGKRIVLTNGCFDLMHTGHVYFLREAAKLGDALIVALNSDESVKELKGPTRPVQSTIERAYLLGNLEIVDTIISFETPRLTAEIEALKPDVYAKAGDYTLETLNPEERAALEKNGAVIQFMPFLRGYSTTSLIAKINAAANTF